jgi:hypothetical protein
MDKINLSNCKKCITSGLQQKKKHFIKTSSQKNMYNAEQKIGIGNGD